MEIENEAPFERRRLAVIAGAMVLAWIIGGAGALLYLLYIPQLRTEISNRKAEISALQPEVQKIQAFVDKTQTLKQKILGLENLTRTRVRAGRMVFTIGTLAAAEDGVWLRDLRIADAGTPAVPRRRFSLSLSGYAGGANALEMNARISRLMIKLESALVLRDGERFADNEALGARIERPLLKNTQTATLNLAATPGRRPQSLACREFIMEVFFESLEPLTALVPEHKSEFSLDLARIKRDPFICPFK